MEQKKYIRQRNINLAFRVSPEERDMIMQKMKMTGFQNLRAYMVKQAVEGRIIQVELDSVNKMVRLLSNTTNNINQIARRVNQINSIYAADIEKIRSDYDVLWEQANEILRRLSELE